MECMGVASECGEQEVGVASGSGWNLWVWLLGVVVRRYIDFLILLIPTPLVSVLFTAASLLFVYFVKMFFVLYNYIHSLICLFVHLCICLCCVIYLCFVCVCLLICLSVLYLLVCLFVYVLFVCVCGYLFLLGLSLHSPDGQHGFNLRRRNRALNY